AVGAMHVPDVVPHRADQLGGYLLQVDDLLVGLVLGVGADGFGLALGGAHGYCPDPAVLSLSRSATRFFISSYCSFIRSSVIPSDLRNGLDTRVRRSSRSANMALIPMSSSIISARP